MASDKADRTQEATPRRLQKAREEGSVPVSRELTSLAGLGAATLLLVMDGPSLGRAFAGRLRDLLLLPASVDPAAAMAQAVRAAVLLVGPLAGVVLLTAAAAVLLQTGFLLRVSAVAPDLGRLDPRRGLKRLFGTGGLVEAAKSLAKMVVFSGAAWLGLSHAWPSLALATFWQPELLMDRLMEEIAHLLLLLLGAQAVITGIDVAWSRYHHASDLRMSREDVRQESREADGDPQVKARIKQMRLARAKKRMLAAVPSATVIITNPTHYAIALAYDRGRQAAPRVVAKGVDEVAARIREMAQSHRVPLFASPPLARALFSVELDAEIPLEHFKAVAEIIAYVWRLRGSAR